MANDRNVPMASSAGASMDGAEFASSGRVQVHLHSRPRIVRTTPTLPALAATSSTAANASSTDSASVENRQESDSSAGKDQPMEDVERTEIDPNDLAAMESQCAQSTVKRWAMYPEISDLEARGSSWLRIGQSFDGVQKLIHGARSGMTNYHNWSITRRFPQPENPDLSKEEWGVRVVIHGVNYRTGQITGSMEAINVPHAADTVVTYWEGEIIDYCNNSLWTNKWAASRETDVKHWNKLEAFSRLDKKR